MDDSVIMGVVPSGVAYPPGTPVWGTDFNAAYALLLRWWGLLDAAAPTDTRPYWEALTEVDFTVNLPDLRAVGQAAAAEAIDVLRLQGSHSHQLGFDDLSVSWLETNIYQLDAQFIAQTDGRDGKVATYRCSCRAVLRKRPDGLLVIRRIDGSVLDVNHEMPFVATYAVNRAKATMVQFQTHTDLLTGDAIPMRELLMSELELNGLVNSKADRTHGNEETFTDVRYLRETISASERKQDNVIRTFEEFSAWFASCTALFQRNGFHKLERFDVSELPERRYKVVAQFHWQATTINGAKIELHTPLTWILVDTGDKYMRIEKLLPFG